MDPLGHLTGRNCRWGRETANSLTPSRKLPQPWSSGASAMPPGLHAPEERVRRGGGGLRNRRFGCCHQVCEKVLLEGAAGFSIEGIEKVSGDRLPEGDRNGVANLPCDIGS